MLENIISETQLALQSAEFQYTALIFGLFILPRFVIRLGIPFALCAFAMGIGASFFNWDIIHSDVVVLLSSLGIISLFLFAGLEIEFSELKKTKTFLIQHLVIGVVLLAITSWLIFRWLDLDIRSSIFLGLAVLTPSTGFILDSIDASTLPPSKKFWIRSQAIATEVTALFLMFILVRSLGAKELIFAMTGMGLLILALPLAFKMFLHVVAPVAPKSEFGFLLLVALLAGVITKKLGAYYLTGAFVVGIVAKRFEKNIPQLTSKSTLKAVKSFTSFFIPFYFFHAGATLKASELSFKAFLIGLGLLAVFLPLRTFSVVVHRKFALKESINESFPIATSLLPNLVFGLVLAELMKTVFHVPDYIVGAVIVYTVGATMAPPILIKYFWKPSLDYMFLADADRRLGEASLHADEV